MLKLYPDIYHAFHAFPMLYCYIVMQINTVVAVVVNLPPPPQTPNAIRLSEPVGGSIGLWNNQPLQLKNRRIWSPFVLP